MNTPTTSSTMTSHRMSPSPSRPRRYLSSLMNTARNTISSASQHFTPEEQEKLNECKMIVRNKGVNKVSSMVGMGGKRRRRTKTHKRKTHRRKTHRRKTQRRKTRRRKH